MNERTFSYSQSLSIHNAKHDFAITEMGNDRPQFYSHTFFLLCLFVYVKEHLSLVKLRL